MKRVLYINYILSEIPKLKTIEIRVTKDIKELQTLLINKANDPITLDCRFVNIDYTGLLKFLEEYKADIQILMFDPVPDTILSRVTKVRKHVQISNKKYLDLYYFSRNLKQIHEELKHHGI